jgi:hypothetical protein
MSARGLAGIAALAGALASVGAAAGPIQDNSFLVEEAYNQETRVVQHIGTWTRHREGGAWDLTFTQEWPLRGQRHQLSYTVPLSRLARAQGGAIGLGDVGLHFRMQVLGVGGGRVAMAPRITALLASGDAGRGLGAGAPGIQINLPVSVALAPRWVTHVNAGATWLRADPGVSPARRAMGVAQSLIWLAAPAFNAVLELTWDRNDAPGVPGHADREEGARIAPGVRWAHDLANGVQIVPGLAAPIGLGPSRGERSLFLYLSVEHGY